MLLQQIDRWADLAPLRLAHRNRKQALTYLDLKKYSDAVSVWLIQNVGSDPQKNSPIVIYCHKQSEMLVLFLACLKAGHPYIPIDVSVPPERLLKIIESSKAAAILSPLCLPEAVKTRRIVWREDLTLQTMLALSSQNTRPQSQRQIDLDDVWYIIFTSGSTGVPKGVQITRQALENFINWINGEYKPREEEIFLNQAPFSFDLSVMDIYMALSSGGTLWSIDQEQITNGKALFESLGESQISYWISTPSFIELCLMDPSFTDKLLPKLRYFLFCGEILPNDTALHLLERFPQAQVINLYGPTECTVAVCGVQITPEIAGRSEPLPVGQSTANCQIYIYPPETLDALTTGAQTRNASLEVLPPGEKGEIVIAGPNVSIGYLNRPELSKQAFFSWDEGGKSQRAYRTGDIGYWLNGQLYYLGRRDFQIKLHGFRIELGEIEEQLRKLPEVKKAVVLPLERRGKNAALQAWIILDKHPKVSGLAAQKLGQQLRRKLGQVLPAYMLPQRYLFIDKVPLTANGKVDRQALQGGHYDPL